MVLLVSYYFSGRNVRLEFAWPEFEAEIPAKIFRPKVRPGAGNCVSHINRINFFDMWMPPIIFCLQARKDMKMKEELTTLVAIPEFHSANLFNFYVQGFFHFRVHRMGFRENRNRVQKLHSRPNWRKIFFFLSLKSHHYSACSFSFFTVPLFNCSTLNQK